MKQHKPTHALRVWPMWCVAFKTPAIKRARIVVTRLWTPVFVVRTLINVDTLRHVLHQVTARAFAGETAQRVGALWFLKIVALIVRCWLQKQFSTGVWWAEVLRNDSQTVALGHSNSKRYIHLHLLGFKSVFWSNHSHENHCLQAKQQRNSINTQRPTRNRTEIP